MGVSGRKDAGGEPETRQNEHRKLIRGVRSLICFVSTFGFGSEF